MAAEIVKLAGGAGAEVITRSPGNDHGMLWALLLQQPLATRQLVQWDSWVEVMGRVLHDVVKHTSNRPRKNDVGSAFELHVVKGPFILPVVPREAWVSVLDER